MRDWIRSKCRSTLPTSLLFERVRVAVGITHDFPTVRLRRVLGVAHRTQSGGVEDGAIVKMQEEHRRIGRDCIEFVNGRQALLGELVLGVKPPTTRTRGTIRPQLKQKASAAAEVMPLSRTSSWPEVSCSTVPACLRAVENLDSPQHDDDGRYQRGRRQYTF